MMKRIGLASSIVVLTILFLSLILSFLQVNQPAMTISGQVPTMGYDNLALKQKLFEVTLKYADVPRRYRAHGETYSIDQEGVKGQKQTWRARTIDPWSFMSQQTLIFTDTRSAVNSIEDEMNKFRRIAFEVKTKESENWTFYADTISQGCSEAIIYQSGARSMSAVLCVTIGQYENITMQFWAQIFGEPLLTMEEYQELFEMLDERMGQTFLSR